MLPSSRELLRGWDRTLRHVVVLHKGRTVTSVAIIVPVLARPHRVAPLIANVARTTKNYRLLFVANESDTAEIEELQACRADYIVVPDSRISWACKINDGFQATTEDWIFTGADDLHFHPDWFSRAMRWALPHVLVVGTNDICNQRVMTGQHSTHSLFRRDYVRDFGTIDQPGLVLHEGYRHDFCDDEAIGTARARGVYAHAYDSIVEHLHPMVGKSEQDSTYTLGKQHSRDGQRLFTKRKTLWTNERLVRASMVPCPERAVCVTATFGQYDSQLRVPVRQDMPVDFICFTDQPDLKVPLPWRVVQIEPMFPDNPRMSAKVPKMMPGELGLDCDDVVWIDASHEITAPSFVREALSARQDGIAAFTHPRRTCVYAEIDALLGSENQNGLYFHRPLKEQITAYLEEGYPRDRGLYACGTLAWDLRVPHVRDFGARWMAETEKWSHQDQCEFPVVAWRMGITPGTFAIPQLDRTLSRGKPWLASQWFRIHKHQVDAPPRFYDVSVLIPFASADSVRTRNFEFVRAHYESKGWEVLIGTCEGEWSKGAALHDAFRAVSHDVLVVVDADCILDDRALDDAVQAVRDGAAWVLPHNQTWRMDQNATSNYLAGRANPRGAKRPATVGGGIVVCSREAWLKVGGIDPRFFGWGGEDISFGRALETLCGPPVIGTGKLYHLWHPPHRPRRGTPEAEALAGRYLEAVGNVEAMLSLVAEAQAVVVPG